MGAAILISHHNVAFFLETMRRARQAIVDKRFDDFRREFLDKLSANDTPAV
jgi:queuine tRNA-ribosyltransferase